MVSSQVEFAVARTFTIDLVTPELMLRPGAGSTLARLAAGRWRRARALLSRARLIRLTIGGGPAEALAALEAALESDLRRQAASVESSDAPGRHS